MQEKSAPERSKGYGVVEFADSAAAQEAISTLTGSVRTQKYTQKRLSEPLDCTSIY